MPKIIGDRMDLHAVVIIVVLLIGQEFGGLLGMFFAPPLAAIVRVIIRRYFLHRWSPRSGLAISSTVDTPIVPSPKPKPATESPHA
jgi:predicted PurR-regulated permease PerM